MLGLNHYLFLDIIIFSIGTIGVIANNKNIISMLLCLEIIFLAVLTNLIAYLNFFHNIELAIFSLLILAIIVAETAVGLAIIILLHKKFKDINVDKLTSLKG